MKRKTPQASRPPDKATWSHEPVEAVQRPSIETEDASDFDDIDPDDDRWDAFLVDEDELDPVPEFGDFWAEDD